MGKKAVKQNPKKGSMKKMYRRSKNKKNYGKGEQQRMRISDSPFSKWIDMLVLAISSGRLDYFLNKFHVLLYSFIITDDVMILFRSSDFSIVLGLHHSGQPVDLDLKMESRFLARHFVSKETKADRAAIRERMMLLAGIVAAIRVLSVAGVSTPSFGLVGTTAFRFSARIQLLGCVRIQLLSERSAVGSAYSTFFYEEENLVDLKHVERSEDGMSEVRRLEKIVTRQSNEIKLLENRCGELEDQNMRHGLNVKEAVVEKGEKSGEGVGEVEKSRGKAEFEIAHDALCSFYDVDVVVHNVVAKLDEANKDIEGCHKEDPLDEGRELDRSNESTRGSDFSLSKVDEITIFQSSKKQTVQLIHQNNMSADKKIILRLIICTTTSHEHSTTCLTNTSR
ncbi:hypothetical protein F511_02938 [Dorcoceras hygrometricum]|uniref:Uncharacterized protein n=1 Tax=Dorcoceras hygrometricum TaxID=472368 RepID=A0A2Z7AKX6_9LAMI|nr:hypothetical protein F511_02938 [Dorcoceras hygrometricum]